MPLSPEWLKLPKRHCDDCGKLYKPVKPLREGERGFCCANCRKSYHKHGGAYRKLKGEMQKMVDKGLHGIEKRLREIVREELTVIVNQMWGKDVADIGAWQRATAAAAISQSLSPCNPPR